MADTVFCVKTQREGEKLARPPFPNALGARIQENVSAEGWTLWLAHSTMLINEYRIDLASKQGTEFLLKQCEAFFFGEGSEAPPEFKAVDESAGESVDKPVDDA